LVRSSVLHNDEIEPLLRAVQLSILVGMIEKADEECPQILTHQFVMRITSGCPPPRVTPRNACARGFVPTRIKILKSLIFKGFSRYAGQTRTPAMHCGHGEAL
jgi:hypothetical protein